MKIRTTLLGTILICAAQYAPASEEVGNAAAQANNPLANMKAFNLQNYYVGRLTKSDDDANQFWLRYAQPFKVLGGDWLMRASLPVNSYPTPPEGGTETGLGDINAFSKTMPTAFPSGSASETSSPRGRPSLTCS